MRDSIKAFLAERQNFFLPSIVLVIFLILFNSSVPSILYYIVFYSIGILASAVLGICTYLTLRIKFSPRYKAFPEYPG
jgi:hypothetical protein